METSDKSSVHEASSAETNIKPGKEQTESIKESRFKNFKEKFKKFAKTRKGKIIIATSCVIFIALAIGGGILIYTLNQKKEPEIKIAENIASDRIYDNYDYIYNSGDNKLVASTIDKVKQLEIVSGEEKIMDYTISPDKKKIAYSLAYNDYKNRIKATNADMTKFNFEPVAFKVYELNLETGENKLIWSIEEIQLGATTQQLYKKKRVVYPDSYVLSGRINSDGTPHSYPVSYVEYVDDIEAGYQFNHIPYDLYVQLMSKQVRIISYDPTSQKLSLAHDNKLIIKNIADNTEKVSPAKDQQSCIFTSGTWKYEFIKLSVDCFYSGGGYGYYDTSVTYKVVNDEPVLLFPNNFHNKSYVTINPQFALIVSGVEYGESDSFLLKKINLSKFEFATQNLAPVGSTGENEFINNLEVIGSTEDLFITSKPKDKNNYSQRIYTIYKYDSIQNKIEKIKEFNLPIDIFSITYNLTNNTLSYYRRYQASSESIIEYRILEITTNEEKELLTIKVPNDSVLYYKPKLVWLDVE